MTLINTNP